MDILRGCRRPDRGLHSVGIAPHVVSSFVGYGAPMRSTSVVTFLAMCVTGALSSLLHLPYGDPRYKARDARELVDHIMDEVFNLTREAEEPAMLYPFEFLFDFAKSDFNVSAMMETFETGITTNETCKTCRYIVKALKDNSGKSRMAAFVGFLWVFCYMNQFTTTEVCHGLISTYKDEIGHIMRTTRSDPEEICTLLFGHTCGVLKSPEHIWEVRLPERKSNTRSRRRLQKRDVKQEVRILQLSDTHFDPHYLPGSLAECDEPLCCREESGQPKNKSQAAGPWGDYRLCDLPYQTLDHMLKHIAETHKLDFGYLTGDIPPHDVWKITKEHNGVVLYNTTHVIAGRLWGLPIYPAVGNHEAVPPNLFPLLDNKEDQYAGKSRWLYKELADSWAGWLPDTALESVRGGGFYMVRPRQGFRVISLNMNFCYFFNFWLIINSTDPGGQLEWLISQLADAEEAGDKVHLIGHIPPGLADCIETWSTMFHRIVERFADTVTGQFYGHTHYDEFSVFYSSEDGAEPINVAYVAPSATTYSYLNPGYRIYTMDKTTKEITSHETYFMNLTEANVAGEPIWRLEYTTKDLGIDASSPSEWDDLVTRMDADDQLFERFYGYFMKLSDHPRNCTGICKERMICHLRTYRSHDYSKCRVQEE